MDDLQQFYRSTVGDQAAALGKAPRLLESGTEAAEDNVRRLAHTLEGSSYGFPEVSLAARVPERAPAGELWPKGRELVEILETITVDVESNTIVGEIAELDVQIPGANGFVVLQKIRSDPGSEPRAGRHVDCRRWQTGCGSQIRAWSRRPHPRALLSSRADRPTQPIHEVLT